MTSKTPENFAKPAKLCAGKAKRIPGRRLRRRRDAATPEAARFYCFFGCEELSEKELMMTWASSLFKGPSTTWGSDTITRPLV